MIVFRMPDQILSRLPLIVVTVVYALIYGWLLVSTDFLPYVMDNNESFSSFWHAASLYNYGPAQSFGLADEAFSPHAAAHPYVHTHQGNFPRVFALLIYALGARSVESQIALTTFTVGLASIFLIYHFFRKVANPAFALVACLVFMTDYLLFAQWQIVTYRVWYGFFFFSTLVCVLHVHETPNRKWTSLMLLNYACLFYFELVFAAFVTTTAGFYLAFLRYRSPGFLARTWALQALGGMAGLAVLSLQAAGYMGWSNFLQDIYLTFLARNDSAGVSSLMAQATKFYESQNVIFWHNLQDKTPHLKLGAFIRSLTSFDWRVHTPLLSLIVWIVAAGWFLSLVPKSVKDRIGAFAVRPARTSVFTVTLGFAAFTMTVFLLLMGASYFEAVRHDIGVFQSISLTTAVPAAVCAVFGYFVINAILRLEMRNTPNRAGGDVAVARLVILASIPLALLAWFISQYWHLYDQSYQPIWHEVLKNWTPRYLNYTAVIGAVVIAVYLASAGASRIFGPRHDQSLAALIPYFISGFAAYAIIYFLSPGYIYSGYLVRHAPFTVFLNDVLIAVAFYAMISVTWRLCQSLRSEFRAPDQTGRAVWPAFLSQFLTQSEVAVIFRISGVFVAAGLTLFALAYWINLQSRYVKWLPPDHYAFLKTLAEPPYRGASFVVDNYAAPVAAYTGEWAYFDPMIANGITAQSKDGLQLMGDAKYLWLADKNVNPDYRKPEYYLCMIPQSLSTTLARLQSGKRLGSGYPGCSRRRLVQLAQERLPKSSPFRLVAIDKAGPERIGFDSWAIVKFEMDDRGRSVTLDWSNSMEPSSVRQTR